MHSKTMKKSGKLKRWLSPQKNNEPVRLEKLERPIPKTKHKPAFRFKITTEVLLIMVIVLLLIILPILIYATGGSLESTAYYNQGVLLIGRV